jgi:hypothetical protein
MTIDTKSAQGKGHIPKDGVHWSRDIWLIGTHALDGHTGSMKGCDKLVECGFTKGHVTPKRHNV